MLHGKHSNKQSTAVILNLRTSPESVKILLLLNIKLFLSMILLFPKVVVFARIKAKISGEKRKILFLSPGESRPESKSYDFEEFHSHEKINLEINYENKCHSERRTKRVPGPCH